MHPRRSSQRKLRALCALTTAGLLLSSLSITGETTALAQQIPTASPATTQAAETTEPGAPPAPTDAPAAPPTGSGPEVIWGTGPGLTAPLRSFAPLSAREQEAGPRVIPLNPVIQPGSQAAEAQSTGRPAVVQTAPLTSTVPSANANFDGISSTGYIPPDTEGDIGYDPGTGKKYYMQFVNVSYQIWDVTNPTAPVSVVGPTIGHTLWSSLSASYPCSQAYPNGGDRGDPVVLFDHLANRWLASQIAISGGYHQCIAISQTADPTGSWYAYDFLWSASKLNDYPKFGVWPDGYYLSVNQFTGGTTWAGPAAAVFDRAAMLDGNPASMQKFEIGTSYNSMLPSDLDGPAPAAETPNYFVEWDDGSWIGPSDALRVWNFHVDWTTPANSTFSLNQVITTDNVNPNMCNYVRTCIPQPDPTQKVDAISDRLMYRLQYRDFGSYQTLVGNHTVDTNGADLAGIHWFELHRTSSWSMYQQGVYAPADSDNRWMGSIAMDGAGNLGLGYSVSSGTTYPSVRYTGRLATDTLGNMQTEATLVSGSGSQSGDAYSYRWGDYSTMSVDPVDGCTFWYTQEYYSSTSGRGWKTRIGSFAFPSCLSVPGAFGKSSPSNGAANQPVRPTLSWGSSSGATSYDYCYDTTNDNDCSNWTSSGSSTGVTLDGLSLNTTYYWQVRANKGGDTTYADGSSTAFWSFTTDSHGTPGDFDGDGRADPTVFEKATGNWFVVGSTDGFFTPALNFGNDTSYIPVPGDYDGDGISDPAVFEKATGNWFVVGSAAGFMAPALNFGNATDYIPVPGDYDGDGKTDAAVFQKSTGNWFVVGSHDGYFTPALSFGNATDYIPVPGDYDGDGKTDPAVFEKATGNWFAVGSTAGFMTPALGFGNATDYIPVPGDYDGDGKMDAAVFQKASGNWFVVGSTDGYFTPALSFGSDTGYIPQQADYDGDRKTDPAVFERATGNWFVIGSTDGFFTPALGFGNDTNYIPVVK